MTHAELFVLALLGHLVGDYLFQNEWMARGKSKCGKGKTWWRSWFTKDSWYGHLCCTVHVVLYTVAVATIMGVINPWLWVVIALPHWFIDRFSMAGKFMQWKNGIHPWDVLKANEVHPSPMQIWSVGFTAPVYIANDNTLHLLMLWLMIRWWL